MNVEGLYLLLHSIERRIKRSKE